MDIETIKERMLNWEDRFGQDLLEIDLIKKATTKKELYEIMYVHILLLKTQHIEAICHAEEFIEELGLRDWNNVRDD